MVLKKTLVLITVFSCLTYGAEFYRDFDISRINHVQLKFRLDPQNSELLNCLKKYYKIEFTQNNKIGKIIYMSSGKTAYTSEKHFASIEIEYSDSSETWRYLDLDGKLCFPDSEMGCFIYYYDYNGNAKCKINYDKKGEPMADSLGAVKYIYSINDTAREIQVNILDYKSKEITDSNGIFRESIIYDSLGNEIEIKFFSENGESIPGEFGIIHNLMEYNDKGNVVKMVFLDSQGKPHINNRLGAAELEYEYDDDGNVILMKYYKALNDTTLVPLTVGNSIRVLYDKCGRMTNMIIYPNDDKTSAAKIDIEYDTDGNKTKQTYYNKTDFNGPASIVVLYDPNGIEIGTTYFDKDGNVLK
jgi:hypothetical protein